MMILSKVVSKQLNEGINEGVRCASMETVDNDSRWF